MGSYTFRWEQPAEEVFVTGTFDDWSKSVKLDKVDTGYEKTISLKKVDEKILYKFVVDGEWKNDSSSQTETDQEGNTNNVLYPDQIKPPNSAAAPVISSVAPGASTTEMAGEQPKSTLPGASREIPAANDDQTFSVNPIPASSGAGNPIHLAPGEKVPDPSTINSNTVESTVHDDPELKSKAEGEQTYSVVPIPATGGAGNPIQLKPGEKVPDPSTITGNTVDSTVKTDKESYENSGANAPVTEPASESAQDDRPPASGAMIPESGGLPMNQDSSDANKENMGPNMSSVGPASTTAALAGQQPIEQRGVPTVVSESQQEAQESPEASGNAEAVGEKKEVEDELKQKVPEEQATSEEEDGGISGKAVAGAAAAGVGAAGAAVVANEVVKDKTSKDPAGALPESTQETMNESAQESSIPQEAGGEDTARETSTAVPQGITDSQKEAGRDPEAAANGEAVQEKSEMEDELLSKIPESEAQGEPAPTESATATTTAPQATSTSASGAPQLDEPSAVGLAPISMNDKPSSEEGEGGGGGGGLNAPADSDAQPGGADLEQKPSADRINALARTAEEHQHSRDVSPRSSSKPTTTTTNTMMEGQAQPKVTSGVAETSAPGKTGPDVSSGGSAVSEKRKSLVERFRGGSQDSGSKASTPASGSGSGSGLGSGSMPASAATGTDKKEKRRSLFGRIKDKLK